jgi:putative intracellular protease/amidase
MRQRSRVSNRSAYNTAREYPGTIAALIVGIGITAALLWAARRAGGWSNLQEDAKDLARQGMDYAREGYGKAREVIADRASRLKGQSETLSE